MLGYVTFRHRQYYPFRAQRYGADAQTMVYRPSDPLMFGINRDERYYISAERVAAPESVRVEGQDFIAYLEPSPLGVRLARLDWTESA